MGRLTRLLVLLLVQVGMGHLAAADHPADPRIDQCNAIDFYIHSAPHQTDFARKLDIEGLMAAMREHQGLVPIKVVHSAAAHALPGQNFTIYLRAGSSDLDVMMQHMCLGQLKFWGKDPPPFEVLNIMDLGGNCGMTPLVLSRLYPKAKVVVVEPGKTNFVTLSLNTGHVENVFAVYAAIWNRMAFTHLNGSVSGRDIKAPDDYASMFGESVPALMDGWTHHRPAVTVPYLMKKFGMETIDFMKMDIEGAELAVLLDPGAPEWLAKVRCLSAEMHYRIFPPTVTIETLHNVLVASGLKKLADLDEYMIWCRDIPAAASTPA